MYGLSKEESFFRESGGVGSGGRFHSLGHSPWLSFPSTASPGHSRSSAPVTHYADLVWRLGAPVSRTRCAPGKALGCPPPLSCGTHSDTGARTDAGAETHTHLPMGATQYTARATLASTPSPPALRLLLGRADGSGKETPPRSANLLLTPIHPTPPPPPRTCHPLPLGSQGGEATLPRLPGLQPDREKRASVGVLAASPAALTHLPGEPGSGSAEWRRARRSGGGCGSGLRSGRCVGVAAGR